MSLLCLPTELFDMVVKNLTAVEMLPLRQVCRSASTSQVIMKAIARYPLLEPTYDNWGALMTISWHKDLFSTWFKKDGGMAEEVKFLSPGGATAFGEGVTLTLSSSGICSSHNLSWPADI